MKLAGLAGGRALTGTIATDQRRMEVLALPLVAVIVVLRVRRRDRRPTSDGRRAV